MKNENLSLSNSLICNRSFIKFLHQGLLMVVVLIGVATPGFSQGFVVEIHGVWKRDNGAIVENRQRVGAGTRITNVSNQSGDSIFVADASSKIVASCSNNCKSLDVPRTESWPEYFWCKFFGCGSRKYTTFVTKGDECNNFDGLAFIDRNGVTNLFEFLKLLSSNKSDRLILKFQKAAGDRIEEKIYDLKTSYPKVTGLQVGFYDVIEGKISSRVLILPSDVYEKEKQLLAELQNKITYFREQGLSNCTIKTFTQSYLDHVAQKYEEQIKKGKKKTKATP